MLNHFEVTDHTEIGMLTVASAWLGAALGTGSADAGEHRRAPNRGH
jgi:hypothetical protein